LLNFTCDVDCWVKALAIPANAKTTTTQKTVKMALQKALYWDIFYVFIYTQKDYAFRKKLYPPLL